MVELSAKVRYVVKGDRELPVPHYPIASCYLKSSDGDPTEEYSLVIWRKYRVASQE